MATFAFDEFVFDDVQYVLTRSGMPVKVDRQVLELLAYLLSHPGRLIPKEELIQHVWQQRVLAENVVSVCVAKLRKALGGSNHPRLGTVYGRGYRFLRPVRRMDAPAPAPTPLPAAAGAPAESGPLVEAPLVGRNSVLASLLGALQQAQAGRGSACALLGEAGIGKTRLCEALEQSAQRAGFAVSWGHCHRLGDVPALWPFLRLMRAWNLSLPGAAEHGEPALHGANKGEGAWREIVLATSDAIQSRAAQQPQLVVIEDLHWADAASLKLLSHLLSTVKQHKLLVLLTARDPLPDDRQRRRVLDHVLGHHGVTRLPLARLTHADVDAYVSARLGPHDAQVARVVFAKSQGNPFFMVELLRPFGAERAPRPEALQLPKAALDIVRQMLEHAGEQGREVLGAAAVVGHDFDLQVLSQLTEHTPERLLELLEPAVSAHLIVPQPDGYTRFSFGHDLIREVLYQDLPSVVRTRMHARTARALALRLELDALSNAEVAHHLLAGLPVSELAEAVQRARTAATAAARVGAYADASALLRRALGALALHDTEGRAAPCQLLFDLARYERAAGEPFTAHLERAVALARERGDRAVLVAAGQLVCGPPGTMGVEGASDILEAALSALPEDAHSERCSMLSHLAWTPPHNWDRQQVAALLDRAEAHASEARPSAVRTLLHGRLYYAGGPDDLSSMRALCERIEQLEPSQSARRRAAWSLEPLVAQLVSHLQRGELSLARRAADGYGAAARELRHAELIWHYERMLAVLQMNTGEYAQAAAALAELDQRAQQLQLHGRVLVVAVDFGELNARTRTLPQAAPATVAAWRPRPGDVPLAFAVKLRTLCQLGCLAEARAELAAFQVERLRDLPRSRDYLATLGHIAFACAKTGSKPEAELLYALLEPYPHQCLVGMSLHSYGPVARTLGCLSRLLGERERARAHYETALQDAQRYGLWPQLALTRYQYARLLRHGSASDVERARSLLFEARAAARSFGMQPLVAASEQLAQSLR